MKLVFLLTLLIYPQLYAQELYSLEDVNPNSITYESVIGPDYFEGKVLPRFQKGGPVYGKYAKQIAGLS